MKENMGIKGSQFRRNSFIKSTRILWNTSKEAPDQSIQETRKKNVETLKCFAQ